MDIKKLPKELAIFPLDRTILLPNRQLSLNIFEERYVNLVNHALKTDRLIGIIQPKPDSQSSKDINDLYNIGCAGKITQFEDHNNGSYSITLTGLCRFEVNNEVLAQGGFRKFSISWDKFKDDSKHKEDHKLNRQTILPKLKEYLIQNEMLCDKWEDLKIIPDEKLVSCLSIICPFSTKEKQALLEAIDIQKRFSLLEAFIDIALQCDIQRVRHH